MIDHEAAICALDYFIEAIFFVTPLAILAALTWRLAR
jgi:hypothetical protein